MHGRQNLDMACDHKETEAKFGQTAHSSSEWSNAHERTVTQVLSALS